MDIGEYVISEEHGFCSGDSKLLDGRRAGWLEYCWIIFSAAPSWCGGRSFGFVWICANWFLGPRVWDPMFRWRTQYLWSDATRQLDFTVDHRPTIKAYVPLLLPPFIWVLRKDRRNAHRSHPLLSAARFVPSMTALLVPPCPLPRGPASVAPHPVDHVSLLQWPSSWRSSSAGRPSTLSGSSPYSGPTTHRPGTRMPTTYRSCTSCTASPRTCRVSSTTCPPPSIRSCTTSCRSSSAPRSRYVLDEVVPAANRAHRS